MFKRHLRDAVSKIQNLGNATALLLKVWSITHISVTLQHVEMQSLRPHLRPSESEYAS